MSDEQLWELCAEGVRIVKFSLSLTIEEQDDLKTELFLKCRGKFDNLNYRAQRASVVKAARNLKIDNWRVTGRRKELVGNNTNIGSIVEGKRDAMLDVENVDYVDWLLGHLSENERDAIVLHAQGFTHKQSAKVLSITVPCFKARFFRAQKRLRKLANNADIASLQSSH